MVICMYFYCVEISGDAAEGPLLKDPKPLKAKTTKAERRALQEAQRAAKASSKG